MEFERLIICTNAPVGQGLPWFYYLAFKDVLGEDKVAICAEENRNYSAGLVKRGLRRVEREMGSVSKAKRNQVESKLTKRSNFVLLFNTADLNYNDVKKLADNPVITLGVYYSDHPLALHDSYKKTVLTTLPLFDMVYTFSPSISPVLYSLGAKVVGVVPFAYCRYNHLPSSGIIPEVINNKVFYFGTWTTEIESWLKPLLEFDLHIEGNQWEKASNPDLRRIGAKKNISVNDNMISKAGKAGVVVNFTRALHGCFHTMKTFELAIAKAAVVSNYSPEQSEFFKDSSEFLYFNTSNEMKTHVQLLLEDDALNKSIRKKAFEKAKPFDYHLRSSELLSILNIIY